TLTRLRVLPSVPLCASLFMARRRPRSPLFPYTTLFRSEIIEANLKIRRTNASETVGAQRLGLYVVGRLATRLGTRVNIAKASSRSEEHTSELQSRFELVCRLLLEKKKTTEPRRTAHTTR